MADTARPSSPAKETTNSQTQSLAGDQPLHPSDAAQRQSTQPTSSLDPSPDPTLETPPPTKPPRPITAREQAEKTLREAFPSLDVSVVKAVLSASGGSVEPAFDALLGMTDPDSQKDMPPPAKPPRPAPQDDVATSTAQSQLEADEMYARQLHEHYSSTSRQERQSLDPNQQAARQRRQGEEDREYSFLDDDLPMIRDNIRKGFLETQSTVNKWVTNFKKKLDGEDDEAFSSQPARPGQPFQAGSHGYSNYGRKSSEMARRSSEMARRSADRERYDADPQVLGDDFSTLELRDVEGAPPKKPNRPLANPNLFKPGSPAAGERKVSFQSGPPNDIDDLYPGSSKASNQHGSIGKSSKWQPLSAVEPSPVTENDPFSLGDSDDERETKAKENRSDEAERLQTATAEAMAGSIGDGAKIEPGTKKGTGAGS